MSKKMFGNGARRIVLFALALLAPCAKNTVFGQALNMDGQSRNFFQISAGPSPQDGLGAPITPDVDVAQNKGANPADSWGPVPTKKDSLANLAPVFLPFLNNGPVFGLPGTVAGDFRYRTQ